MMNNELICELLADITGSMVAHHWPTAHPVPGHRFDFMAAGDTLLKVVRAANAANVPVSVYLDGWGRVAYSLTVPEIDDWAGVFRERLANELIGAGNTRSATETASPSG